MKIKKFLKGLLIFFIVLAALAVIWIAFSLIGRIDAAKVIPDTAVIRITVPNPSRLINGLLAHESLDDISTVPELAYMSPLIESLKENPLLKNRLLHNLMGGKMELALLSDDADGSFAAAYDLKLLSPLLRLIPIASNFVTIPNLYYVQAGKNSRFEYRLDDMTVFIGPHRNVLFITNSSKVFEARLAADNEALPFKNIKISNYDAAVRLSHQFINELFSDQDPKIAEILDSLEFDSTVEAGLSIYPKKIEFYLTVPMTSNQSTLSKFLQSRSRASDINERLPGSTQYATILSAGTLRELYQAAIVFMPDMEDTLKFAESSSRIAFGLTLDELLFSWTGNEYAVFGMEGRPHPVYAIQVEDERKRQQVFDKAFSSILLNEDTRLSLDGTRLPRISIPDFLQLLLRKWDINLPSPYYTIYRDFILVSESADTLLAALRAMQRNDVLPRTNTWRNIAGGKTAATAFSVYYSMDRSMPFFLRQNTALSGYLSLYRQGLVRISFNRGVVDFSFSLIPGSGNGVTLVGGYPLDIGRASSQVFGMGNRIFFAAGNTAFSMDITDNSVYDITGQGRHWVIPAVGAGGKDAVNAWVVSDRGRVTLVDGNMDPHENFPVLTGLRISAAPVAFEGCVYLCDDDGHVIMIDTKANQKNWETVFTVPLISPPSFLSVPARGRTPGANYAAVYPKSFFGEIYLLDAQGKTLPGWPAPISTGNIKDDEFTASVGIGFGTPLVFTHNNRVLTAFVCQTGELIVYDENASSISPFPLFLNNMFYFQPVFDGTYLWLISQDGTLYRVSLEGEMLYQNIPDFVVKEVGYITFFDTNGDNIPEIFITGEGNALHAYTRNFRSLEGFPLPIWGKPYFIEAQGGKKAEVFGIGMDRKLYRWQFR
ncbi:MAG: hypothetical protein LBU88_06010 [Treponema sp.]|jgi:outer membrane protein assembly factor BamB|nr:hypothetical protein [Treponema sp.]